MARKCKNCAKYAHYGHRKNNGKEYCATHKLRGMVCLSEPACYEIECTKNARYNFENESKALYCFEHKKNDMLYIGVKRCAFDGCNKTKPTYNYMNEKNGMYCATHAIKDMVTLEKYKQKNNPSKCCVTCKTKSRKYNYVGLSPLYCAKCSKPNMISIHVPRCQCGTQATFGFPNAKKIKETCGRHQKPGMVSLINNCAKENCFQRGLYHCEHEKKGRYCFQHKEDDMISVHKNKSCVVVECEKRARYDYLDSAGQKYCSMHKKPGMANLHNNCKFLHCLKQGCYNYSGEKKGIYCKEHKDLEMISVKKCMTCAIDDCNSNPFYGYKNEQKTHCKKHISDEMIYLGITCAEDNCNSTNKSYNYKGEKIGLFCSKHAQENMIDVIRLKCSKCEKVAIKGHVGQKPSRCFQHRSPNMISRPRKQCVQSICTNLALFGTEHDKQIHCELHKEDDEMNLLERECIVCNLPYILDHEKKCEICSTSNFFIQRKHLAKQRAVSEYLIKNLPDKNFIEDKTIDRGICGLERPDIRYDCGTHWLIIEVDENQHRVYECEKTRMINISQSFGGMPVWFVRYNPDGFRHPSEKRRKINVSQSKRLETLVRWIRYLFDRNPGDGGMFVGVIKIFFDGYQEGNVTEECLLKIME